LCVGLFEDLLDLRFLQDVPGERFRLFGPFDLYRGVGDDVVFSDQPFEKGSQGGEGGVLALDLPGGAEAGDLEA